MVLLAGVRCLSALHRAYLSDLLRFDVYEGQFKNLFVYDHSVYGVSANSRVADDPRFFRMLFVRQGGFDDHYIVRYRSFCGLVTLCFRRLLFVGLPSFEFDSFLFLYGGYCLASRGGNYRRRWGGFYSRRFFIFDSWSVCGCVVFEWFRPSYWFLVEREFCVAVRDV